MTPEEVSQNTTLPAARRYDVDWLRMTAVFLVFLFHTLLIFAGNFPWAIKNSETSLLITGPAVLLGALGMPLFFVISGMAIFWGLGYMESRLGRLDASLYIKERVARLIVPLIFGLFTHVALMRYYTQLHNGTFSGSFIEFLPSHLANFFNFANPSGLIAIWFGGHLWFLVILFIFSIVLYPLFVKLRDDGIRKRLGRVAELCMKPGGMYLFLIPVILIEFFKPLEIIGSLITEIGGWSVLSYVCFMIFGYMFASQPKFEEAIEKHGMPAFLLGVFLAVVICPFYIVWTVFADTLASTIVRLLFAIFGWSMMLAILSFAKKSLNSDHKWRRPLNRSVLPFYVLHQSIMIPIAFYVVQFSLGILEKYLLIIGISVVIIGVCVLVIRQVNVLRFLFGMRLKPPKNLET
jgi:peptidoglycan/LPS O-acetylase OafA/YrhL